MINNAVFSEEDILALKNTTDEGLKKLVSDVLVQAENALKNGGDIKLLGFGYYYTGDRAYFEKAREVMRNQVENALWVSDEYDPNAYNGYDIRTALETENRTNTMATGISLFGDLLDEEERNYFIEQTYTKGIRAILEDWVLPGHKIHALDTMGHNFWIVITSAAGLGAVILKDYIPDADKCLEEAIRAMKAWFEYKGNPLNAKPQNIDNGGYYEAVTYFDYSMHVYLEFANVYRRLTGEHPFDDTKLMENAAKFVLNCWYPSDGEKDYYAGFGDCEFGHCMLHCPMHLLEYGIDMPELRYYVQDRNRNSTDNLLRALVWNKIYGGDAVMPTAKSACYDKIGWAIFRDSYEKNSTMLAVKCGDTWNHAHADCAHFSLYRGGKPEIWDTMQADSYSSAVYHEYYVESVGHNVLLFNGHGQDFRDNYKNHAHLPGKLYNFVDDGGFRYVVADGTGPMSRYFRKHHRHFLWLDGFILVYDDVECYECGKVSFLLHGKENNCFRMLSPATVENKTGWIDGGDKVTAVYQSYNVHTDDDGHAKFCGIMLLDDSLTPEFEVIENGWKITCGKTKVYINLRADGKVMHRNSISVLDGIATDAMILVDADGKYAVANGSMVRKDGVSYLDTLARITGWADSELR